MRYELLDEPELATMEAAHHSPCAVCPPRADSEMPCDAALLLSDVRALRRTLSSVAQVLAAGPS